MTDTRQELEMKANKNHELHDQIDELTNTLKDMEQSLRDARNEILDNKNFLQIKTAKVEEYEKTIGQLRLDLYEKESYHKKKVTSLEDSLAEVRNTLKNKTVNAVSLKADSRLVIWRRCWGGGGQSHLQNPNSTFCEWVTGSLPWQRSEDRQL